MINFMIYDDNMADSEKLSILIKSTIPEAKIIITNNISNAKELLSNDIDIVFLDIELENEANGIEFATYVNKRFPEISVVFVTGYITYSEEIYIARHSAFLVKPVSSYKLSRVINFIKENKAYNKDVYIMADNSNINLKDIMYIEIIGRKLMLYNDNGEKFILRSKKLSEFEKSLPLYFVRCHHSFCVNMMYIRTLKRYDAILKDGIAIPVSQNRYSETKKKHMIFLDRGKKRCLT